MSDTAMQQDRSAAVLDTRSQRLSQLARRSAHFFKKIPPAVWRLLAVLLLVIWLAHSLARLFWLIIPEPSLPDAQVAANALVSDVATSGVHRVDIEALKQVQVFGRVDEEAVAAEVEARNAAAPGIEDEAVDTQLRLRLQGIMDSSDESQGRAVIASGSTQALYAPGDELPEGRNVTLEKILSQRVILNNNGRYESLWLYQEGEFTSRQPSRNEPAYEAPSRSWEGDDMELTGVDEPGDESMDDGEHMGPVEEPEPDVPSTVEQMSRSLSDVVSMSIHREGGKIVGYEIRPGRDSAMFESLGLASGDIVKAVNGTELTSPQRVMELYRNMGDATSASLLIERNGQEVTIDIDLE